MLPQSYLEYSNMIEEIEEKKREQTEEKLKIKDVKFDFNEGKFYFEGLEPEKILEKKEIIRQWIKKLFYTERDRWNCYIKDVGYPFGLNLYKYVGQQLYPDTAIIELIKDDIYNSLLNHKDIKEVHCLQLLQVDDKMYCGFIVELENDAFEAEEVLKTT
ncbi:MAG: DUF2634 domain-containing protein [Fusobacterium sp.]|nr:DUF2634 domain-containing protein [Fusobacterium sp.]